MGRPPLCRLAPDISDEIRSVVAEFYDELGYSEAEFSRVLQRGSHWLRNVLFRRGSQIVARDAHAILDEMKDLLIEQGASRDFIAAVLFYLSHCHCALHPPVKFSPFGFAILQKHVAALSESLCDFLREYGEEVSPRLVARYFRDENRRISAAHNLEHDLAENADDCVAAVMLGSHAYQGVTLVLPLRHQVPPQVSARINSRLKKRA